MERAWLEGADAQPVSEAVTRVLTARGALVDEHTPTHVRFAGLALDQHRFERGGVVTLVQPTLEREVELRVRVRSALTSRIFWSTVAVELAIALAVFILNPPPGTWFAVGVLLWLVFVAVGLVHLGTLPSSRQAERDLLAAFLAEAAPLAERALTAEERLRREAEDEVAAEVLARDLKSRKA